MAAHSNGHLFGCVANNTAVADFTKLKHNKLNYSEMVNIIVLVQATIL